WVHIVHVCAILEDGLPEKYTDNEIRQRIKLIRKNLFDANIGTKKDVTTRAITNILSIIHQYFPNQIQMNNDDVNFIEDFVYLFLVRANQDGVIRIDHKDS
ncbi:MAG: hypothetical protein EB000_03175, partial [Alphaproteobacteria bacterium]|nr:hypothetical protein [Alphaproteobacteria bacterium]